MPRVRHYSLSFSDIEAGCLNGEWCENNPIGSPTVGKKSVDVTSTDFLPTARFTAWQEIPQARADYLAAVLQQTASLSDGTQALLLKPSSRSCSSRNPMKSPVH